MKKATAYANANIALIKYWGKSNDRLNVPAVASVSMTLGDLGTQVTIFTNDADEHQLIIDRRPTDEQARKRLVDYLETVRRLYPYRGFLTIYSQATVPYKAGLASSASFFAALAKATNDLLGLGLDDVELSKLARLGSASAARSIFGGLVGLHGGPASSHDDSHAFSLSHHHSLDLAMLIAVTSKDIKPMSSREAMAICRQSSPYFDTFVSEQPADFTDALAAINEGNFSRLGELMEHSTMKMFATMWTAKPAIMYWQPTSLRLIDLVYRLRQEHGPIAYFTLDAGPNVKILSRKEHVALISSFISSQVPAIELIKQFPGEGARLSTNHLA